MTKKTRLIILLFCVACFFVVAPILVAYSMGFRFDFEKMKITATGGIYVRTFPAAGQITIDSNISEKPGMFANSIFVQSLLPKNHTVSIKKTGYYDYSKILAVQENQVTKLENVLLFKKNIQFEATADKTQSPFISQEKFIIKNNNLYYSNVLENNGITASQKLVPVFKNLIAFTISNNNILWLGTDGFLYKSDLSTLSAVPSRLTLSPLKIIKKGSYKIITDANNIFVNNNSSLLFFNGKTNNLDNFYSSVTDAKISPDGKNIAFFNSDKIYLHSFLDTPLGTGKKFAEIFSGNKIADLQWLNNDYIIFTSGDKIIISEIDYRGNINAITLSQTATSIFFNSQTGKLYALSDNSLLVSEKLTP